MKTINIRISDKDIADYRLNTDNISFSEIEKKIKRKTIREALYTCQRIAEKKGLSKMSMEEINKEIEAVRKNNAENNS